VDDGITSVPGRWPPLAFADLEGLAVAGPMSRLAGAELSQMNGFGVLGLDSSSSWYCRQELLATRFPLDGLPTRSDDS
jgi:hypothetical protein